MMDFLTTIATHITTDFDKWVDTQLVNNGFLVAGVFTVLTSTALYLVRNVPGRIVRAVLHRRTVEVVVESDNEHFVSIARALNEAAIGAFARSLMLDGDRMTIGMSRSISRFRGRLCLVDRSTPPDGSGWNLPKNRLTLKFLAGDRRKVESLFNEHVAELRKASERKLRLYSAEFGSMSFMRNLPLRRRESIFVDPVTLDRLEHRIDRFLGERDWYDRHGVPYKLAIILHGPPGTGKTTVARYLAAYAGRDLVTLKLGTLRDAIAGLNREDGDGPASTGGACRPSGGRAEPARPGYVGLIEDIDTSDATHKRFEHHGEGPNAFRVEKTTNVAMSDILNAIDGVHAPDDLILIATTNHLDKLDPALIRKGRFDELVHLGPLGDRDIRRMIAFHHPDAVLDPAVEFAPITGAVLQDLVMTLDGASAVAAALPKATFIREGAE